MRCDGDRPAYWRDGDRIMAGGLLGPRIIEPTEAHSLAGYLSREALAASGQGDAGSARFLARQAIDLNQAMAAA